MPSERIQRRIESLLNQADEAIDAGDWEAAGRKARAVLAIEADNSDASAYLQMAVANGFEFEALGPGHQPPVAIPPSPSEPPAVTIPQSFAAGRYRVERFLGEGAKKRVFLAHDTLLDRDVAFALIRAEGLDAAGRQRITREAQAMARLGNHPNVVPVFDLGQEGETPYLVSEFMAGGSIADVLREADGPLRLGQALKIAVDICRGLETAHAANVIHRDLKPGNVWLTGDGTAKIGDFGLAVALDRSRLTQQGAMIGTATYMPPEQALGGEVTPQSDLYALGCLLYEMVTGRAPFVADDPIAVISQHINTPPVGPSWLSDRCPVQLEEVILHLLRKPPAERPPSAAAVRDVLEGINPHDPVPTRSRSRSGVLDRLARGVFVGRTRETERLRRALDEAVSGRGRVVMLAGEPGIGKTRTAQEVETYARMRGARVYWGRSHEDSGAPPFWPWIQVGRACAAEDDGSLPVSALASQHRELVRLFPEFRDTPGFVEPHSDDDPEVAQFKLLEAYNAFLRAAAEQEPLVVILDDLHWADRQTLRLLQHVARDLPLPRLLIVGTYRETELVRTQPLAETLVELNREGVVERIPLRRLDEKDVREYLTAVRKRPPPRGLVRRVFETTEGNPFFLSQIANLLTEEGALDEDSLSDERLPEGVREALGVRLDRLTPEANELLQIAAIAGREFSHAELALMSEQDDDRLLALIEESLDARVIEERGRPGHYWFTHGLIQETLLEEMSTARRVRLHGRIGEALERTHRGREAELASRLALHFAESAVMNQAHAAPAFKYSQLAGEQALLGFAWGEAARHFEQALEYGSLANLDALQEARLRAGRGRALMAMDRPEGFEETERAFWGYTEAGDPLAAFEVAKVVGTHPTAGGADAQAMFRRAVADLPSGSSEAAMMEVCLGSRLGWSNALDEATPLFDHALEVARTQEDALLELTVLSRRAFFLDKADDQLSTHQRAAELAEELGNDRVAAGSHYGACTCLLAIGDDRLREAAAHANASMEAAMRTGQVFAISQAAAVQCYASLFLGEAVSPEILSLLEQDRVNPRAIWARFLNALFHGSDDDCVAIADDCGSLAYEAPSCGAVLPIWWHYSKDPRFLRLAATWGESLGPMPAWVEVLTGTARAMLAVTSRDQGKMKEWRDTAQTLWAWDRVAPPTLEMIRGLIDEELGDVDEALAHFERDMASFSPHLTRWILPAYERARLLTRTGRAEAPEAVTELIERASRLRMNRFRDLGLGLRLEVQGVTGSHTSVDSLSATLDVDRPDLTAQTAPDGTVTILFSDIEGSTTLNVQLGDDRWMEVLADHNAKIRRCIAAHRGFEVKTEGDAFMIAFQSARHALRCAIAIQRAFVEHDRVRVRIGLHTGEPVKQGDDFYGTHVVMASRIAAQARGGEILVSALLRELVASSGEFKLGGGRGLELRGLPGIHRVYPLMA